MTSSLVVSYSPYALYIRSICSLSSLRMRDCSSGTSVKVHLTLFAMTEKRIENASHEFQRGEKPRERRGGAVLRWVNLGCCPSGQFTSRMA